MNVIPQLEFELAYFEDTVKHFNHYTTGTPPEDDDDDDEEEEEEEEENDDSYGYHSRTKAFTDEISDA